MKNYIYDQNVKIEIGHFRLFREEIIKIIGRFELNRFPKNIKQSNFFFLNINFFDRYALICLFLLFFLPKERCHIFLHSCRKRGISLKLLSLFFKSSKIYVFSMHLRQLLIKCNFSEQNVILIEFPNVNLTNDKEKFIKKTKLNIQKKMTCVIWGKSSQNIPHSIISKLISRNILIKFIQNPINRVEKYKHKNITYYSHVDEKYLFEIISNSDFGLVYLSGLEEEYYKNSMNASGVFLTNRNYSLPSILIFSSSHYDQEIMLDNISTRIDHDQDFEEKLNLFIRNLGSNKFKNVKYKNLNDFLN